MAGDAFLIRDAGQTKQKQGTQVSAGAANAGDIVALDETGRLDPSVMPPGFGADTISVPASEALVAGDFVNLHANAGAMNARKADNSNGRQADGFVTAAVSSAATATVYPLDAANTGVSGLTPGSRYYLGTAGGVISSPLDAVAQVGTGKIDQYLGIARTATELVTTDDGYVVL
ncbi:hypothetical protein D3C81_572180 [compost metagenome]